MSKTGENILSRDKYSGWHIVTLPYQCLYLFDHRKCRSREKSFCYNMNLIDKVINDITNVGVDGLLG